MIARAIIAEDERLLAVNLEAELHALWPELEIAALVGDGEDAVEEALASRPDVLFLDIRMPGLSGIEAAQALTEQWPDDGAPFPLLVFVTAYDQFALQAFERAAFDYVLKPVEPTRLARTCVRLRAALAERAAARRRAPDVAEAGRADLDAVVAQLRSVLAAANADAPRAPSAPLRVIQAGLGDVVRLVSVDEVVCFEAADKYVRVLTATGEFLIRMSLRELTPRLDATRFWQVHRGTVVRADAIASARRDEAGKVTLTLHGRADRVVVSRLHAHLFKAM